MNQVHDGKRAAARISTSLLVALLALLAFSALAFAQDDGTPHTAIIVVQDNDGAVVREITFTTPISGLAALEATGLDVDTSDTSFGAAVCSIASTGCPADDCFCNQNEFWGYNFGDGESWQSWPMGADTTLLTNTVNLEGWRWGVYQAPMVSPQVVQVLPALDWLQAQQSPTNGGYGSMAGAVETMLAIGANGLAAADWQIEGGTSSLADYSRVRQARFARDNVAASGKLAVALSAADACFARNARTPNSWLDDSGIYSPDSGFNAWGILGAVAISETVPTEATDALRAAALPEGGWEWQAGFGADTNTTSLAIQALVATGTPITATEIVSGVAWLKTAQQEDGGFSYDAVNDYGSDANSTAYVLQGLAAAGEDATSDAWRVDGASAIDYLASLQLEDGSVQWQADGGTNALATQQFVPALLARPYPLAIAEKEVCQ